MQIRRDFGSVVTAMVTPFLSDAEQTVDLEGAIRLANHLLKNGTDSLLLTGSTGEAAQLSLEEKQTLVDRIRRYTPQGTRIIVSTGDTSTRRVIDHSAKAFEWGADAVLISVPEYIKPPQQAMYIHFSSIAKALPNKPIIIYNIPGRTGSEILPETVSRLARENPNIIGIKQSMPNLDRVSELKMLCPADFQIYSGDDSLTLPMLALGAKGVVSVASHLEGKMIGKMINVFKAGNPIMANNYHQLLFPLYKALFMTTNPIPVKEALYQQNLIASPKLRTLCEMEPADKEKLKTALQEFAVAKSSFIQKNKASGRDER